MPTQTLKRDLTVETPSGTCPATLHYPEGQGPWPAVILYMDGPGIRPSVHEIAARLASSGYAVFLPDLFYRAGPYAPIDAAKVFTTPDLREAHREKYMSTATPANVMADTAALLQAIEAAPEAREGPVAVLGYCMGGRLALIAAGTFPDRIAAVASYHGGGLATDKPNSPHLLAPKIKAKAYIGGATEDRNFTDEQKTMLEAALTEAGIEHTIETYPAKHGWVPRDMAVHDPAEAEHHWQTLVPFLDDVFKTAG